eukprot:COSAG01_NODE_2310_length_7942_cov_7.405330_9_plen_76_part_00
MDGAYRLLLRLLEHIGPGGDISCRPDTIAAALTRYARTPSCQLPNTICALQVLLCCPTHAAAGHHIMARLLCLCW